VEERKRYLIKLFADRCGFKKTIKTQIEFLFKFYNNTYNVSEEKLTELKKEFNTDRYIEELIPITDEYFTIQELEEIVKFYSSKVGRKLFNQGFTKKIEELGKKTNLQIERGFIKNNGR
jgi:hypothetical protein